MKEAAMSGDRAPVRRGARAAALLVLTGLLATASTAVGQVRLRVPDESPSGPFYARIERGLVLQTDQWVAIAFYRDPECVRASFNLLNFFDVANIPGIFSCPLTVSGFEIWDDPRGPAPKQSKLRGNGEVPVWFVSVDDYQAALPGLIMTELLAMPSLMQGIATDFEETLHPLEGAQRSMLQIVASGDLPDGRRFRFMAVEASAELRHVWIEFQEGRR
jgi:hypothetical protein